MKLGAMIFAGKKWAKRGVNGILLKKAGRKGATKVAIVSCDKWKGKVYDDLLVQGELLKRGMAAEIVSWQDAGVKWGEFSAALVGSMWGYQGYLKEFETWLAKVEKMTKLVNPVSVIRENYDKAKQIRALEKAGVPTIETKVVGVGEMKGEMRRFGFPFVVKPVISGSGENTFLIKDEGEFEQVRGELEKVNATRELLVQPFVSEVSAGEIGVVTIGGEIVNAVRRFPGVIEGGYRLEAVAKETVAEDVKELVRKIVGMEEYREATYLRIDVVERENGPVVMELEAFEPQLYYYLLKGKERREMLTKIGEEIDRAAKV